jgi:geranylgeranyl pyrophosphate synthase
MSKPLTLEAFRAAIAAPLEGLYNERLERAQEIDPSYAELIGELRGLILRGGKRVRPYLTYLTYKGLGGELDEAIIDLAASQELFHNFLIIHDDVFDHDVMRYGGLNIAGSYRLKLPKSLATIDRNHLANTMAVMGGDVTVGFGFSQIIESDFPAERKLEALRRVERMIFEVAGGETLDVLLPTFKLADVTEERLLQTYRYKTASYSFEAPMQLGAIMAGGDETVMAAIKNFAIPLGVAFQLADDLLGVYGNESELGKSILSDLREGKRTLLMVKGLELADEAGREMLTESLGNRRASYSDLAKVRGILDVCGARSYIEKLAQTEVDQALAVVGEIGLDAAVRGQIEELSRFSIKRHT